MDCNKALIAALEDVIKVLEPPMALAQESEDIELRRKIGAFASKIISEIDYDLIPYLNGKKDGKISC